MFYRPARPVASARALKIRRFPASVSPRGERSEASAFHPPAPEQTLCLTSGGSALRGATGHVATLQFVAPFLLRDVIAGECCVRCQQIAPLPLHTILRFS